MFSLSVRKSEKCLTTFQKIFRHFDFVLMS
jgi:hypothetical protein